VILADSVGRGVGDESANDVEHKLLEDWRLLEQAIPSSVGLGPHWNVWKGVCVAGC